MKKQMIRGNIILSIALACILCVVNVHNNQNIITTNSNRFKEGNTTITTETNIVNDNKKDSGITVEEGILEGDDTVDNKGKDKDKDNTDKKETNKDSGKEGCTNCTTTTETKTKDTKTTNREYDITIKKPKKEETPEKKEEKKEKKEKKEKPKKILPKAGEGKLPLLEIAVITTVLGIIYVSNVKSMQKRLQI